MTVELPAAQQAVREPGRSHVVAGVQSAMRQIIEAERARAGVPGCAVVVVADGDILLMEGFGRRDLDACLPVTPETLFPIGSSTKTFTAAALALLADEGRLDLDAPLASVLPDLAMQDPVAAQALSARDCLSHRSGLPRHDLLWQAGDGIITRSDLIAALPHLAPSRPFRESYQYNNLLFIVAGELAGRLTGSTYEGALETRILQPLGMTRTNCSVTTTQHDADHATPYLRPDDESRPAEIPFASRELAGPAGAINSSARDLAAWLLALTGRGVGGREPVLSPGLLRELKTPVISMPADAAGPVRAIGYGLGLMIEEYRGSRVWHHGGNIDGFSAQVLTRDDGVGIAVLCNLHATWLRDAVPYLLLDILDGVESPDHGAHFRDRLAARFAAADAARSIESPGDLPASPVRPLADYAGRYRHPGYGDCVVSNGRTGLTWTYRGLPQGVLRHRHLEVFEVHVLLNGAGTTLPAQFTHNLDGQVDALLVQLEPEVPLIRFERA